MDLNREAMEFHTRNFERLVRRLPDCAAVALLTGIETVVEDADAMEEGDALNEDEVKTDLQRVFDRTLEGF